MPKFLRRHTDYKSRLGKKRKKKQVWRRAKGRHNKVRLKRKGYPIKVMVGFKQSKKAKPIFVSNMKELEKVKSGSTIILGKVGKKKKIEMLKFAKDKKINVANLNVNKELEAINKEKDK
jgi:large subunit ribosomal protein L32e